MKPFNWWDALHRFGYDKLHHREALAIMEGILHGVDIEFDGDRTLQRHGTNNPNVYEHTEKVSAVIEKDVKAGKKAGPFDAPPLPHFAVSPIGAVPKKSDPSTIRVTHNLSHPFKGTTSVNSGIRDEAFSLDTVNTACDAIRRLGYACYLIKLDVEAAYKLIPVREEDWHLLGFMWEGKYYYERTLPFGLKSSCRLWDLYAAALHHFFTRLGVDVVIHYIDDFLFVIQSKQRADDLLIQCLELCKHLGVPMAAHKTEGPTTRLTFLGIQLDTESMQASLPEEKLSELKRLTTDWCEMKQASTNECEIMAGKLNFASYVVRPGRFYMRRIWNHLALCKRLCKHPDAKLQLSKEALADLQWWRDYIHQWNGISIMLEHEWTQAHKIELFMDACNTGYGAACGNEWFAGTWTAEHLAAAHRKQRISMPFLELLALTFTAATWGHKWKGKKVLFRSDCMPVVQAIQDRTSRNPSSMYLLRYLSSLACQHHFDFRCEHIAGIDNDVADILSRSGDCSQFRSALPSAQQHMTPVVFVPLPPPQQQ
jgi:hypothetical protein